MRESLLPCACTCQPCACHTRWGQRDQRTEGPRVLTILVCCLSKQWVSCPRISADESQKETPPSSGLSIISSTCPEAGHFQQDLSRGHVRQAVRAAGLRVRAEMGQKAQLRRAPSPCRQPVLGRLSSEVREAMAKAKVQDRSSGGWGGQSLRLGHSNSTCQAPDKTLGTW